jgi:predicted DNA-binding ribbon-helix-helix protein
MAKTPAKSKDTKSKDPARSAKDTVGKRITFDLETWHALDLMARDKMMTLQELADEAFRDLLKKHNRPTDLKSALRESARQIAANQNKSPARGRRK